MCEKKMVVVVMGPFPCLMGGSKFVLVSVTWTGVSVYVEHLVAHSAGVSGL